MAVALSFTTEAGGLAGAYLTADFKVTCEPPFATSIPTKRTADRSGSASPNTKFIAAGFSSKTSPLDLVRIGQWTSRRNLQESVPHELL
jgi:hypothetical protein